MRLHKSLLRLVFILICFGLLIISAGFLTHKVILSGQTEAVALTNAAKKTLERQGVFLNFFTRSRNTILSIRESDSLNQFLQHPSSSRQELEELALTMAKSQKDIMKIRYIDQTGMEVIRIDRSELGARAIILPSTEMQNKAHRYFYYEAITQPQNQVWFSNLDLNEEHGEIELPYKATMRASMPLYHQDKFRGILIINYFMQPLFDELVNTPLYNTILADSDGEIIIHFDQSRNWTRYTKKNNLSYDILHIDEVMENETYLSDKFYSRQLNLPLEQKLILILSLNNKHLEFQNSLSNKSLLYSSGITLIITVIFVILFARLLNNIYIDHKKKDKYISKLKKLNNQKNNLLLKNKVYMDMASDGVHILDKEGNIVVFSHSFAQMLGYTDNEISKLNVADWDVQIPKEQIAAAMQSFTYQPRKLETRHRRKDGTIIDVEVNAKWIATPDGDLFYASSRDITERIQMEKELQKLATIDTLTQLPMRRVFMNRLSDELERCHRQQGYTVAVILLDLDHFKTINDTYGHGTGDKVLKVVANILSDEIRKVDAVGRLGGEEFGLILTSTNEDMAIHFTNRIRKRIEETAITFGQSIITCTASLGITEINTLDTNIDDVLERADKALYQAKDRGRNRVEIYHQSK